MITKPRRDTLNNSTPGSKWLSAFLCSLAICVCGNLSREKEDQPMDSGRFSSLPKFGIVIPGLLLREFLSKHDQIPEIPIDQIVWGLPSGKLT